MSLEHVEKLIKDHKVEFVDLRFTDMRGVQHHVTFPKSIVEASLFEDGKMFDGSSISGWKGINESDMVLLPDAGHRVPGSVHRRSDPGPDLRHPRSRPPCRPTRAIRAASPSAPSPTSSRAASPTRVLRSGTGILHLRQRPFRQ
jgi:hypothetical protein